MAHKNALQTTNLLTPRGPGGKIEVRVCSDGQSAWGVGDRMKLDGESSVTWVPSIGLKWITPMKQGETIDQKNQHRTFTTTLQEVKEDGSIVLNYGADTRITVPYISCCDVNTSCLRTTYSYE